MIYSTYKESIINLMSSNLRPRLKRTNGDKTNIKTNTNLLRLNLKIDSIYIICKDEYGRYTQPFQYNIYRYQNSSDVLDESNISLSDYIKILLELTRGWSI